MKAQKKKQKKIELLAMIEKAIRKALQESREMENQGKKRSRKKVMLFIFWEMDCNAKMQVNVGMKRKDLVPEKEDEEHVVAADLLTFGALQLLDGLVSVDIGSGLEVGEGPSTVVLASTPTLMALSNDCE